MAAASSSARFLKSTSNASGEVKRSCSSGRKKRCWVRPASCSVCIPRSVALVVTAMISLVLLMQSGVSILPDAHFALIGIEGVDLVRENAADRHFLGSERDEAI